MQALRTIDGDPIAETVVCDEHEAFINSFTPPTYDQWDGEDSVRVDEVTANRMGLRCQICGSQDTDPQD